MKFRTRPFEIEAVQFKDLNEDEVRAFTGPKNFFVLDDEDRGDDPEIIANVYDYLHSTWVGVKDGQWIIQGQKGEYYPCDPEIFVAKYEPIISMPKVISVAGESIEDRIARGGGDRDRGSVIEAPGTMGKMKGAVE